MYMKPILVQALLYILFLACGRSALAQFPIHTAEGKSGLLVAGGEGVSLLNYEVSESRVGVKTFWSLPTHSVNEPLTEIMFDAGFSATKGKRDLFKGGSFTPGFDLGLTLLHTLEKQPNRSQSARSGYHQFFGRVAVDMVERKVAEPNDEDTLTLDSLAGTSLGLGGGYNHAFTENLVWSWSALAQHHWNSAEGLKEKDVCLQERTGVDGNGTPLAVASCDKRFIASLTDEWRGQLRTDVFWVARAFGDESSATLGFLTSASLDVGARAASSFNVSIGPTVQRPEHPTQVLFAVLLEGVDLANNAGQSPKFRDRVRLRLYVGVPFEFLK